MAQVDFFQGHYDEALQSLALAKTLLKDQAGFYSLFIDKWSILCHCFKTGSAENLKKLQLFRDEAIKSNHWDSVRECDLFEAILTNNDQLIRRLIMGTPFEHYRQRVRRLYGKDVKSSGQYLLKLGDDKNESTEIFDPYHKALYKKPHLLAVYDALTLDFYKPSSLGFLFQKIYPTEKFNPYSSPPRILRLLTRLDSWFINHNSPLRVVFKKSEFALTSLTPLHIRIQRGNKLSAKNGKFSELKYHFNNRTFSTTVVSETMGISNASAKRLIQQAIADGKVITVGRGRGTLYRLIARKRNVSAA